MSDLPTRFDLQNIARDHILQNTQKIDPAVIDTEGSDANIFVGVSAVVGDTVTRQLGYRAAALTLDGSEDEDLDRYVFDKSGGEVVRKGASAALTTVRIFRATTTAGAGDIPAGTKIQTATGADYITTTGASLGAGDITTRAEARAIQAGKASQVGRREIDRFSAIGLLFDATLQVTNDAASAGGEEVESDEVLRNRFRAYWKTVRRGVLRAIEFGATSVPGVTSAQAVEVLSEGGFPARIVNLYIADSSGVASDALAQQVRISLNDYRGGGIQVLISTSLPQTVTVQLRLTFKANVDTVTIADTVRAAVVNFINSIAVNGTLFVADLYSVLRRYSEDGLIVTKDTIVAPIGDLVPAIGQTLRTTLANVTVV
jgi:hypothetical protein